MKNFVKILFLFLAFLLLFTEGQVLAVQNNLENASLIEKYLTSHKANIIEYATKYNFIDDKEIVD
jgi:hypothetical protein